MASPPIWWGETGGEEARDGNRAREAAGEEEKARKECETPERGVGDGGGRNDVISIDSRGEYLLTVLHNCYRWADRREVGGPITLKLQLDKTQQCIM